MLQKFVLLDKNGLEESAGIEVHHYSYGAAIQYSSVYSGDTWMREIAEEFHLSLCFGSPSI